MIFDSICPCFSGHTRPPIYFNLVLNKTLDKQGGVNAANESRKFREEMTALLGAYALADCLRIKNKNKKLFTWFSKHFKVKSRLDYLFISECLLNRLQKCEKKTAILTDHALVQISLQHNVMKRGSGFWKFNSSLLKDKEYVALVKALIKQTAEENNSITNKGLLFDLIKMNIRALSIKYSSRKKREKDKLETNIMSEIKSLERQDESEDIIEKLDLLREELEKFMKSKVEGAAIRARAEWIEEGEKNTAYFLNLEKHKAENKIITQLKTADGVILDDPKDILEEQYKFYSNLYKQNSLGKESLNNAEKTFLNNN